jgi:hypothetical protein
MTTSTSPENRITDLESQYAQLDSSLVRAIAGDYDLDTQYNDVLKQLDLLAESVAADDDIDFDPSGTGGQKSSTPTDSQTKSSTPSSISGTTPATDLTSLAHALASIDTDDGSLSDRGAIGYFETLNDDDKVLRLADMFPSMKEFDRVYALKKAHGNFVRAVDSLLNHAFLQESNDEDRVPLKGVDGFAEEYTIPTSRKRCNRKSKNKSLSDSSQTILPTYSPLNLDDIKTISESSVSPAPGTSHLPRSPMVSSYSEAAQSEYAKASSYYRRSKSDHLMGGAAAYYSSVARDHRAAAKRENTAHFNQIAVTQSSNTHVDLHGIPSEDGKRIALEYVSKWWDRLGEGRIKTGGKSAIGAGFDVVVGKGTHSAGGRAVLGPAVFSALQAAGWKVSAHSGVLNVTGRKKI